MKKDIGNYIVQSDGVIISKKLKRPLKHWDMKGYRQVKIDGVAITIHRVLAMHFLPNKENKKEVNHKNGIKHDNRLENLEWVTHSENIKHAYDNGKIPKKKLRKLKDSDYGEIKTMRMAGASFEEIAKRFSICKSYASVIFNHR